MNLHFVTQSNQMIACFDFSLVRVSSVSKSLLSFFDLSLFVSLVINQSLFFLGHPFNLCNFCLFKVKFILSLVKSFFGFVFLVIQFLHLVLDLVDISLILVQLLSHVLSLVSLSLFFLLYFINFCILCIYNLLKFIEFVPYVILFLLKLFNLWFNCN